MITLNHKILLKRDFKDATQTTIQLSNKNKKYMTVDQITKIIDKFKTKETKIMVRGLNIQKWSTLKGMDTEFNHKDFIEYYENKVTDATKFTTFAQIQIVVLRNK
jgi:hypothetical protein